MISKAKKNTIEKENQLNFVSTFRNFYWCTELFTAQDKIKCPIEYLFFTCSKDRKIYWSKNGSIIAPSLTPHITCTWSKFQMFGVIGPLGAPLSAVLM
jgi:hypothetical protein